ncbi:hypothetical protein [Priestia megaterium]|uniref:hypothetical protein n=1 Tax=Priestia megaterium TaxID=1404 RepID=UPI003D07917E
MKFIDEDQIDKLKEALLLVDDVLSNIKAETEYYDYEEYLSLRSTKYYLKQAIFCQERDFMQ